MSHKANYWLAQLDPSKVKAGAFRVLFHLCDHHNDGRDPKLACFPSQETLKEKTGMSNGALNNALNDMEAAGLIRRRRSTVPGSRERRTYYVLGCDFQAHDEQTPENGDCINPPEQTPVSERTNSSLGPNKLQPTGEEPVRTEKVTGKVTTKPPTEEFSENWRPDAELTAWAQAQGFTIEEIEEQTRRWIIHWRDELKAQPPHPLGKTWRGWMVKEIEFKAKRKGAAPARDDSAKKWRDRIDRKYGAAAPGGAA